jgi:cytochrome c
MLASLALLLAAGVQADVPARPLSVLVFSKTAGFRHDSIPAAREAMVRLANQNKWSISLTEDSTWFTAPRLATYDAVVFLLTTGDVLDADQETAFRGFIQGGGGYVGVHAASDTEYDWEWYGRLVGAYFMSHPAVQEGTVHIEDREHPTTSFLPHPWIRTDEWYDFRQNPRSRVHVLATLDESSYKGGKMGEDHPIMWCHEFDGGRSWYTAMGHTKESYQEPLFLRTLEEGIKWAARRSR